MKTSKNKIGVGTSLFSSTADIRFKYKPMETSVKEVPVDSVGQMKCFFYIKDTEY